MAEVILKNIKKVYPHQDGKKKKKKGAEERRSNLTVTDEGVLAVHDFNLSIKDKEFIVLVGPSGCGKSTTLRMVAGLEEISGGELYIDGTARSTTLRRRTGDIAMVFQNYALYPHMTVAGEHGVSALKLRKVPKEEIAQRVAQAAEILGHYRVPRPQAEGALRRPAAARRHRPRDRARAQGPAHGRAAVQSGRQAPQPDAGRARSSCASASTPPLST